VTDYAIGVCGFGRCGSTMLMTMLVAGGCPPGNAQHPPYEGDLGVLHDGRPLAGACVKLLDSVAYYGVPDAPAWRFVWLDRDPIQQARSQVKLLRAVAPGIVDGDPTAQFASSYHRDRMPTISAYRDHGEVLVLRYERILLDPQAAAWTLRDKVWPTLDVDAAARVVHSRSGRCRPDLAVEAALTRGAR